MTLASVSRATKKSRDRILIYGTEGVGKTSFAAGAPSVVFLPVEKIGDHVDAPRFPRPSTWTEALDAIRTLTTDAHDYQWLAIDTVDALEAMCWAEVCRAAGKASIEDFGFGRGFQAVLDEWRKLLRALEQLEDAKGMGVIFVAHALVRTFKNPEGADFDRYQLKLHDKAGGLFKEWTDLVLFSQYETFAVEKDRKVKGVSSGARVMRTQRTAAYDAKNRHALPETIQLGWVELQDAMREALQAQKNTIAASLAALALEDGSDLQKKIAVTVEAAGDNLQALVKINNRLAVLVAEKGQNANV